MVSAKVGEFSQKNNMKQNINWLRVGEVVIIICLVCIVLSLGYMIGEFKVWKNKVEKCNTEFKCPAGSSPYCQRVSKETPFLMK
jgi:Tfp pilus assembly protein PilO